jgi:deoxyribodipyrimidine photo-lyase
MNDIHDERIRVLRDAPVQGGDYVLYWMQAACRAECNHALEYAIRRANELRKPVVACFGLTAGFPEANARHYTFLLEGLQDAARALDRRGIPLVVRLGSPDEVAAELSGAACLAVTDRGYLHIQREWRARAAESMRCALVQVETDVIVPVESAASREQYSAGTLRPRILKRLREFMVPLRTTRLRADPPDTRFDARSLDDIPALVEALGVDGSVPPVPGTHGGARHASRRLASFVARALARYHEAGRDPALDAGSGLSPYLHFGQISPLAIALALKGRRGPGAAAFLEQLIIRRELSMNFTHFQPYYDQFTGLPAWSRETLLDHAKDRRPHLYSPAELEAGKTGDPYWNAAQQEMVCTGTMHGYMRMYWGKKILEWTERPEQAFQIALALNNKYQLDGRDPNGFAGVAWCFGKHDRPWARRPVFGTVRYMNDRGLERKFDMAAYVRRVAG